jgi:hypothetical protein
MTLHASLQGQDANLRLKYLLAMPGRSAYAPLDESRYKAIVDAREVYDWPAVQQRYAPFPQNLTGYAVAGQRQISLYRADGRAPDKLKSGNPPGFGVRISVPFGLLKATLLKNVTEFAEDHVRYNRQDLKSYATDNNAGGFASADRHLYEIDFGQWREFKRPPVQGKLPSPTILANSNSLDNATKIAIDTLKPTGEIFLLFEVDLADISSVRRPGSAALQRINWNTV